MDPSRLGVTVEELNQIVRLLILAIPVAWAAWTVTHEEVFREVREYCAERSRSCRLLFCRKLFYLFTCEYCFSHWVALGVEVGSRFKLLFDDWRGYVIGFAALVWVANIYMNLYLRLRVDIHHDRAAAERLQHGGADRHAA